MFKLAGFICFVNEPAYFLNYSLFNWQEMQFDVYRRITLIGPVQNSFHHSCQGVNTHLEGTMIFARKFTLLRVTKINR